MRTANHYVAVFVAFLASGIALPIAGTPAPESKAISGVISGDVQKLGFRAMLLKQAIKYNLAGSAQNTKEGTVQFTLQGDENRIDQAVMDIRNGTKKSSNVIVSTSPAKLDPNLDKFTIIGWTSTSRNITHPYDLVFPLRTDDEPISKKAAKDVWHEILRNTLEGDDLNKLEDGDE